MVRFGCRLSSRMALTTILVATALGTALGTASPVRADDPPFVGWTQATPPLADAYRPSSADECAAGRPSCVQTTIRRMSRRFAPLAEACNHNAVFSLAYLRTTQEYARAAADPTFFQDVRFVNHEDAVFTKYYFSAYDAWAANRRAYVPVAWRIAFDAAATRQASGSGDLMLGMSAHVNRDLPFVLAAIGLVRPDGVSRKPDHDKVNVFLNRVVQPLIDEEAARFDPAMDDANTPYGLSYTALMQVLVTWRETAWRNAERLVNAPDKAARNRVAQQIEDYAATTARSLLADFQYTPPVTTTVARDHFCSIHHG